MPHVLTLNGGSSSIRFSVCDVTDTSKLVSGKIERMGTADAGMTVDDLRQGEKKQINMALDADDHRSAGAFLLEWLASQSLLDSIGAVGHRVVHGMQHTDPERITPELVKELKAIKPYDPEHLPSEIELIELVSKRLPQVPQVACFDTAFHRSMPRQATLLPIPRRYAAKGVQRYGFHGLSYTYLMEELARAGDVAATRGRVILAHLGNGASLAAVLDGKSVDTSMGFTPTAGLVMSSRSGDLDPGLVSFLAATESMDAAGFERMVTHESGLLGISETSSDIRDLLEKEGTDVRAAEAVTVFLLPGEEMDWRLRGGSGGRRYVGIRRWHRRERLAGALAHLRGFGIFGHRLGCGGERAQRRGDFERVGDGAGHPYRRGVGDREFHPACAGLGCA